MELYDLLIESTQTGLDTLFQENHFKPGHNGPYYDPETPVRNTSHWVITLLKTYEITDNNEYLNAAEECIEYLLTEPSIRPNGFSYFHRKSPGKNFCNSLIGQAWTIEALSVADKWLDEDEIIETAEELFLIHEFSSRTGCWRSVGVNGENLPIDTTFNHQLWFAAAGSLLAESNKSSNEINRRIDEFMDELSKLIRVYSNGLIYHPLRPDIDLQDYIGFINDGSYGRTGAKLIFRMFRSDKNKRIINKAIGYHSFNLYALSLLHNYDPNHPFWDSDTFKSAIQYGGSESFYRSLKENKFGYPYNVSGIEMAYAGYELDMMSTQQMERWVSAQFSNHYDTDKNLLCKNTEDPYTLSARLYEATRLPNITVDLNNEH